MQVKPEENVSAKRSNVRYIEDTETAKNIKLQQETRLISVGPPRTIVSGGEIYR